MAAAVESSLVHGVFVLNGLSTAVRRAHTATVTPKGQTCVSQSPTALLKAAKRLSHGTQVCF